MMTVWKCLKMTAHSTAGVFFFFFVFFLVFWNRSYGSLCIEIVVYVCYNLVSHFKFVWLCGLVTECDWLRSAKLQFFFTMIYGVMYSVSFDEKADCHFAIVTSNQKKVEYLINWFFFFGNKVNDNIEWESNHILFPKIVVFISIIQRIYRKINLFFFWK